MQVPYKFYSYVLSLLLLVSVSCNTLKPGSKPKDDASAAAREQTGTTAIETDNAQADTLAKPSLEVKPDFLTDSLKKQEEQKKKKKKKKNVFLGYKIKKGMTKTGKGSRQTIEVFHYLKTYKEPNPYVPIKYYFHVKRRRIYKTRNIDPKISKILHGPYKKMVGKVVVEEGYFFIGTKHLRWERYNRNNILLAKTHFEKGFPRDAQISYYDAAQQKIKEVIPYENGEVQGDYYKFYPNGGLEWEGQYERGRKVGRWINYYSFRNRRHYEYQYPESSYDEPFEPYLVKEYDRHNTLIYEKDKLDKRPSTTGSK